MSQVVDEANDEDEPLETEVEVVAESVILAVRDHALQSRNPRLDLLVGHLVDIGKEVVELEQSISMVYFRQDCDGFSNTLLQLADLQLDVVAFFLVTFREGTKLLEDLGH